MDRLHYSGDSIITGTDIARAVLEYANALAHADTSDTVTIPTLREDGTVGRSDLLLGPASQLVTDSEASEHDEVVDEHLVSDLRERADRLRRFGGVSGPEARPSDPEEGSWAGLDYI